LTQDGVDERFFEATPIGLVIDALAEKPPSAFTLAAQRQALLRFLALE
jgi:hypothetical protein